jgi:penicillin-binding protein 1C
LTQAVRYYDLGLALGDGEVSLLELVHAYSVLAQQGIDYPLHTSWENITPKQGYIFSPEVTSLIANILSDPWARQVEFGMDNILNFPVQTAVKTGTSTDYHDAWAIGFNYRYTVGVWLGNLNQKAMDGITGAMGPAMILRSVFAELNQHAITQPLYLSSQLIQKEVCVPQLLWQTKAQNCYLRAEYFIPEHRVNTLPIMAVMQNTIRLIKPSENLRLAIDPRIPLAQQAFEFKVSGVKADDWVYWFIDQQPVKMLQGNYYLWSLSAGSHQVKIKVYRKDQLIYQSGIIHFVVKP